MPYKNTLPIDSGVPVELIVVLQASVFLYGDYIEVYCKPLVVEPERELQHS